MARAAAFLSCCLLLAALVCLVSADESGDVSFPGGDVSFPGGVVRRLDASSDSHRRLLSLPAGAAPGGPFETASTSHRKLSGYVRWSISSCTITSANKVRCKRGFAVACCNTQTCTSNPDGSGGTCASNTVLGCCGKK